MDFQIPLPGLSRDINSLTSQEKTFLAYFAAIDRHSIEPVMDAYAGIGPKGYGVFLPGKDDQDQGTHPVGSPVGGDPEKE